MTTALPQSSQSPQRNDDPLTARIIAAAIEVHKHLGPGLLESIYEQAIHVEFRLREIPFQPQQPFDVVYKGRVLKGQRLDLVVDNLVVVELKAKLKPADIALAQTLSYLRVTGLKRALIINFSFPRLVDGIQRVCSDWRP